MSKVCSLCGKKPVTGNNVSHSKRRTKRRFSPNLISKKFSGVRLLVCTRCLRTLQKPERIKKIVKSKDENKKVQAKVEEKKVGTKASSEK